MTHRSTRRYNHVGHSVHTPSAEYGTEFKRIGRRIKVHDDGCWIYNSAPDFHSHLRVQGKQVYVYRWVYEILHKPIPDGYVLHHKCFKPGCVNPDHLEPMTSSDHARLHNSHH